MSGPFNQGVSTVPTLINSSQVLVTGNAASANALTVRQFGTGNVFSAQTTTGSTALFVNAAGNVGIGTTNPAELLTVQSGNIYMPSYSRIIMNGGNSNAYLWTNFAKYGDSVTLSFNYYNDGTNRFPNAGLTTSRITLLYNEIDVAVSSANGTEATVGVKLTPGATSWVALSDARLKTIIEPISNAVDKVDQINPVIYTLIDDVTATKRVGVIAQDVLKVQPEAVYEGSDGMLGVRYTELIPLAFAAIKELSALVKTQAQTIETLSERLAALEARP